MNDLVLCTGPPPLKELSRDTAMFLVAVFCLMLMVLMGMGQAVVLALTATLAMVYIVDTRHIRRMLGYQMATDLAFTYWLTTIASLTLGGLTMAIAAGLMYTVLSRELRAAWGSERLALNGDVAPGRILAHCTTWLSQYLRSSTRSLFYGSSVDAPEPLRVEWIEIDPAYGYAGTRLAEAVAWTKNSLRRYYERCWARMQHTLSVFLD